MAAKLYFVLVLMIISHLAAPWAAYSERRGFRGVMTRTEQHINFTRAARSSHQRLSMLAARLDAAASSASGRVSAQTPLQLDSDGYGYDMTLSIGTPPQKLSAAADTGSDLVWVKCGACKECTPRGSPSYYPDKASSFSKLPCSSRLCSDLGSHCGAAAGGGFVAGECDYAYFYGIADDPDHYTKGYLGTETFTLGSDADAVRGIGFGCTNMSEGYYGTSSGLVGLGRGSLSLVSQLKAGAFSYCLDRDATKQCPLLFGAAAVMSGAGIQTTPLLPASPYYSVDLQRISIGAVQTPGPGTKGYGTLFDSGTTLSFLSEPAYTQAKKAMLSQTKLPKAADRDGYEMCFHTTTAGDGGGGGGGGGLGLGAVPKMVLHFDGADMALPLENYFAKVDRDVICWIVQKSPSLSVVGNIMQMNYHIKYDVDEAVLHFQPAKCGSV